MTTPYSCDLKKISKNSIFLLDISSSASQLITVGNARGEKVSNTKPLGRPPIKNPRSVKWTVRVDRAEASILDAFCKRKNVSRADGVRLAIRNLQDKTGRSSPVPTSYCENFKRRHSYSKQNTAQRPQPLERLGALHKKPICRAAARAPRSESPVRIPQRPRTPLPTCWPCRPRPAPSPPP